MAAALVAALAIAAAGGRAAASRKFDDEIVSGDTIFLWSYTNKAIEVESTAAQARFDLRGDWQALTIERVAGAGGVRSRDSVYLKAHTGLCLGVDDKQEVHTENGTCAVWKIEAEGHEAAIRSGDTIFLALSGATVSGYMDVEGDPSNLVRVRLTERGSWQSMRIEREVPDAVRLGDYVTLTTQTGAKLDVQGEKVAARWAEAGPFRALFLEKDENVGPWMHALHIYGGSGRALYSGDRVNLWAYSGKLLEVQAEAVQARWDKAGTWQTFVIENEGAGGPIQRGTRVFLKAHTGHYVEIRDTHAEAIGTAAGPAGSFTIQLYQGGGTEPRGRYRQAVVLALLCLAACAIVLYECYWSLAARAAARAAALGKGGGSAAEGGPLQVPAGGPGEQQQQPPSATVAGAAAAGAPRLEALEAPRWIASAQIVAGHFYNYTWGASWTQFFFVLSGFVLAYIEMAKPPGRGPQMSQLRYVAHRMVTLYPTFLFVLVISAIQWEHTALDWMTLPLQVLMVHAWLPITYKRQGEQVWRWTGVQWVAVSWFMSVLILYWLLLRPLAARVRRMSLKACFAALLALWLWSSVFWVLEQRVLQDHFGCKGEKQWCQAAVSDALIYHGAVGMLHVFVAGVVMARVFILTCTRDAATGEAPGPATQRLSLDWARAPFLFRYGACFGYLGFGLLVWLVGKDGYRKYRYFFHNGGLLPILLLVLIGAALGGDPLVRYLFQNRIAQVLARLSYAQYLLQVNVYYWMMSMFPLGDALVPLSVVFPLALFVTAYLVERLVTRVGVEWLKRAKGKERDGTVGRVITLLESRSWVARAAPAESKNRGAGGAGAAASPSGGEADEERPAAVPCETLRSRSAAAPVAAEPAGAGSTGARMAPAAPAATATPPPPTAPCRSEPSPCP